jgi:hypothetical protein
MTSIGLRTGDEDGPQWQVLDRDDPQLARPETLRWLHDAPSANKLEDHYCGTPVISLAGPAVQPTVGPASCVRQAACTSGRRLCAVPEGVDGIVPRTCLTHAPVIGDAPVAFARLP